MGERLEKRGERFTPTFYFCITHCLLNFLLCPNDLPRTFPEKASLDTSAWVARRFACPVRKPCRRTCTRCPMCTRCRDKPPCIEGVQKHLALWPCAAPSAAGLLLVMLSPSGSSSHNKFVAVPSFLSFRAPFLSVLLVLVAYFAPRVDAGDETDSNRAKTASAIARSLRDLERIDLHLSSSSYAGAKMPRGHRSRANELRPASRSRLVPSTDMHASPSRSCLVPSTDMHASRSRSRLVPNTDMTHHHAPASFLPTRLSLRPSATSDDRS